MTMLKDKRFTVTKTKTTMSAKELEDFLTRHKMSDHSIAEILGVTKPAVDHWLMRRRSIPPTAAKVIRFLDRHPGMITVF